MADKKKPDVSREASGYVVVTNFTERGKTRGYVAGETFPRPDDNVGPEAMKRLIAGGYIKEK